MRIAFALLAIAALAAASSAPAGAQSLPKLKPGAWETTSMDDGKSIEAMLAKMPPEMREMMRKQMAAQAGKPQTSRVCITGNDEAFAQRMQQQMGADMKCDMSNIRQSGATYTWSSRCTMAKMTMTGEHSLTMKGADAYEMVNKTKSEGGPMGPTNSVVSSSGRYLGADCKAHNALTFEEQMKGLEDPRRSGKAR